MLGWVWMFLILAIIAAIFGFGGVVAAAAGIAKILFFVFLVVVVIGLLMGRRVVSYDVRPRAARRSSAAFSSS